MTRLDRIINLLEGYDGLAAAGVDSHPGSTYGKLLLAELRAEKEMLKQELTEHGCRRKN